MVVAAMLAVPVIVIVPVVAMSVVAVPVVAMSVVAVPVVGIVVIAAAMGIRAMGSVVPVRICMTLAVPMRLVELAGSVVIVDVRIRIRVRVVVGVLARGVATVRIRIDRLAVRHDDAAVAVHGPAVLGVADDGIRRLLRVKNIAVKDLLTDGSDRTQDGVKRLSF